MLEIAYLNCKRCFELNGTKYIKIERNKSIHNRREKALENVDNVDTPTIRNKAIEACLNCDYTSPKLAEVVEPEIKKRTGIKQISYKPLEKS